MTRPTLPAASGARSIPVPEPQRPPAAVYEMRLLRTAAEREEAAALRQDRQRWFTLHSLPIPTRADIPAQFRKAQTLPAGLFEYGRLLACTIPEPDGRAFIARIQASAAHRPNATGPATASSAPTRPRPRGASPCTATTTQPSSAPPPPCMDVPLRPATRSSSTGRTSVIALSSPGGTIRSTATPAA